MPNNATLLPTGIRTSDIVSFAYLSRTVPHSVVDEALECTNRVTYRLRDLPNDLIVYFAIMMAFYKDANMSEVLRCVLEGVDLVFGKKGPVITSKSGISKARARVGWEPLKVIFDGIAVPIATPNTKGAFFHEWRVVAMDGCLINTADTKKNEDAFGRATNQNKKPAAYPQLRMVCLAECGTHVVFKLVTGGYFNGEITLAKSLINSLQPDMICLADRLFFGFELWNAACATGASLLWRIKANVHFEVIQVLDDDSYIALYHPSERDKENKDKPPVKVRVFDYEVADSVRKKTENFRLVTNILDPSKAKALELARLYMQRWEIELIYGEVKIRLNANQVYLRSGTPELVLQELYGLMLAHYAIRSVMHEAALKSKLDPDELSFTSAIRIIRRKLLRTGDFSPSANLP